MVWALQRMDEYRVAGRMLMVDVNGGLVQGRPRLGRMVGEKVGVGNTMMPEEWAKDRKEWRALVHM